MKEQVQCTFRPNYDQFTGKFANLFVSDDILLARMQRSFTFDKEHDSFFLIQFNRLEISKINKLIVLIVGTMH